MEWDEEQEELAKANVAKNSEVTLSEAEVQKFEAEADKYWDEFYNIHQNRFFKDRHWLFTEFPELAPNQGKHHAPEKVGTQECELPQHDGPRRIFEIGSGVGNTVFPILKYNDDPNLMVYASDFSSNAISILKESPEFDPVRCTAFVLDATATDWNEVPFEAGSLDIIVMIFVLSAIEPTKMQHVVNQCFKYLRPGGLVLLRDYGRYDLAQLRFKKGKCLKENFYVRGDGTRCYYFTSEELREMFTTAGFEERQNVVDRRLQVNRGKMLKMYRVWMQTKYQKPIEA